MIWCSYCILCIPLMFNVYDSYPDINWIISKKNRREIIKSNNKTRRCIYIWMKISCYKQNIYFVLHILIILRHQSWIFSYRRNENRRRLRFSRQPALGCGACRNFHDRAQAAKIRLVFHALDVDKTPQIHR